MGLKLKTTISLILAVNVLAWQSNVCAEEQISTSSFLRELVGFWSGRAVQTPVGPRPYNIHFEWLSAQCIYGIANNGFSNHTWTFCLDGKKILNLTFLSDFSGNKTPINFNVFILKKELFIFKADTHQFMEVQISRYGRTRWIKVYHYGKLYVSIFLEHMK